MWEKITVSWHINLGLIKCFEALTKHFLPSSLSTSFCSLVTDLSANSARASAWWRTLSQTVSKRLSSAELTCNHILFLHYLPLNKIERLWALSGLKVIPLRAEKDIRGIYRTGPRVPLWSGSKFYGYVTIRASTLVKNICDKWSWGFWFGLGIHKRGNKDKLKFIGLKGFIDWGKRAASTFDCFPLHQGLGRWMADEWCWLLTSLHLAVSVLSWVEKDSSFFEACKSHTR